MAKRTRNEAPRKQVMCELYNIDISDSTIELPIKSCQSSGSGKNDHIYAVVFMDAIHYHISHEWRIVKRAVYVDMDSKKTFLVCVLAKMKVRSFGYQI